MTSTEGGRPNQGADNQPKRGRGRPAAPQEKAANGEGSFKFVASKGVWRGRVTVGLKLDGTPITKEVSSKNREEAHRKFLALSTHLAPVRDGRAPTLAEWAETWLTKVNTTAHRAVSTVQNARDDVDRNIIRDGIGRIRIDALTADHVDRWLSDLALRGMTKDSISTYWKHLRQIMQFAVARRMVTHNVAADAVMPANVKPPKAKRILSPAEAVKFVEWCSLPEDPWGAYLLTVAMLGLRPSEGAALQWSKINLDTGVVRIDAAMKRQKGAPVTIGELKTGDKHRRNVQAPPVVIDVLRRHAETQAVARAVYGDVWPAQWDDLVFRTDAGQPCHQSNIRKQLTRACHDAGVPRLTPYELRHSCATLLLRDLPINVVADMLGTSERMLRKHYNHVDDAVLVAGVGAWEKILASD